MQPYYEHAGITIYHGAAQDVLPLVTADVLLTDPPFGIDGGRGSDAARDKKGRYATLSGGWEDTEDYIREQVVPVIAWAIHHVQRGAVTPGTRCLTFYPRPAELGCFYHSTAPRHGPWGFVMFSPILYYGHDYRAGRGAWPSSITVMEAAEQNGHPCPKPLRAWKWLLAKVSQEGESVVDPFCGSGTTLRAAKDLGRRAIGIEIEERYCEIAARRLAQEVLLPVALNGYDDLQPAFF